MLWILTMFPIFHKMDDISARKSKGHENVALSNDESIAVCEVHYSNSNSRVVLQNAMWEFAAILCLLLV